MSLPLILRGWCILAVVLLTAYGVLIIRDTTSLKQQAAAAATEADRLLPLESSAENRYNDLEAKQRRERSEYSGQEAILASTAVMQAKEEYEELKAQLESAREQNEQLSTQAAALQLRIVPVLAIALFHLFGFFMISVDRREEQRTQDPRRARRR